ncbi:hypothetical protein W822_15615 [Advenella kashmirensis W13003]|uniref:Bacteriophage lambda Replication protein O N-terminal domain-containing protein n=1 Tax=Advenella kashmirensis W13003 TaxID=1424334 RepID=V8QQB6_9BURK|nr:hypothetical protein W822_15615 [Advenella kashmirensis W13003]
MARKTTSPRQNRDGSRFLALPHVVLESEAFKSLTGHQIKLLLDIAMQLNKGNVNNGRLQASWRYLSEDRGWTSKDTINRALVALQERGLIFCTRQGSFPKSTSWFAVTWMPLYHHSDMHCGPQSLPRGAYAHWQEKITSSCTETGPTKSPIGPKFVQENSIIGPKTVPMEGKIAIS